MHARRARASSCRPGRCQRAQLERPQARRLRRVVLERAAQRVVERGTLAALGEHDHAVEHAERRGAEDRALFRVAVQRRQLGGAGRQLARIDPSERPAALAVPTEFAVAQAPRAGRRAREVRLDERGVALLQREQRAVHRQLDRHDRHLRLVALRQLFELERGTAPRPRDAPARRGRRVCSAAPLAVRAGRRSACARERLALGEQRLALLCRKAARRRACERHERHRARRAVARDPRARARVRAGPWRRESGFQPGWWLNMQAARTSIGASPRSAARRATSPDRARELGDAWPREKRAIVISIARAQPLARVLDQVERLERVARVAHRRRRSRTPAAAASAAARQWWTVLRRSVSGSAAWK